MKNGICALVAQAMCVREAEIRDVEQIKLGMTNDSYRFECCGKKYIVRMPGVGSAQMINRREEAAVYEVLAGKNICDDVVFFDPESGMKITAYLEKSRVCDPFSETDVRCCMKKLAQFHMLDLHVGHSFDLFERIDFYEGLRESSSTYEDYEEVKCKVLALRPFVEEHSGNYTLTHIDAVSDNFLFVPEESGEEIRLIDWEYAGMQDPHVDIAMFCIYAMYDRVQFDWLIDLYFDGCCDPVTRTKLYSYVAICGLLWSNWCEYKHKMGEDFGEYALKQYIYARDYSEIAREEIMKLEENFRA